MTRKHLVFFLSILLAGIIVSCSSDDDGGSSTANSVVMPVTLSIPSTDGPVTRVGDPGTYEKFKLPKYAYIYIVCLDGEGDSVIVSSTPTLDETKWKKEEYTGNLSTSGDSVYRYTGDLKVVLPTGRSANGDVYVALSTVPLEGLPQGGEGYKRDDHASLTVQNYKFKVTDAVHDELVNIYSTPYNYRPDGTTYYGKLKELNTVNPRLDIVLYHIAAKLDVMWNVSQSAQDSVAIDSMAFTMPDADESYIFRPLETTQSKTYTDTVNISVGNQWYGRDYFYVIPITSTSTYSFQTSVKLKNGNRRSRTIETDGIINKLQPFTPWIRGTITIN